MTAGIGPNFAYGGGCYLDDGGPIAVYRDAASDAPTIAHGMYTSRQIPKGGGVEPPFHYNTINIGGGVVQVKAYDDTAAGAAYLANLNLWNLGWRWKEEATVWDPSNAIPLQPGTTSAFFYSHFKINTLGEAQMLKTSPSAANANHGALVVVSWGSTGSKGGGPISFRCADSHSDRKLWVPSSPDPDVQALAWQLDSTHTVAPAFGPTGFYSVSNGYDQGGIISSPPVELMPGVFYLVMTGRRNEANPGSPAPIQGVPSSKLFTSTDDCQTWHFDSDLNNGDATGIATQESNICKLSDGSLYAMHRNPGAVSSIGGPRYYQVRPPGSSWSSLTSLADQMVGAQSARPDILEVSNGDGTHVMFMVTRPLGYARLALLYASTDHGVTWAGPSPFSAGTGVLPGTSNMPAPYNGPGGQHTYTQMVEKQTRIPGVRDGIIGCFFSFSYDSSVVDGVGNGATMFFQEMVHAA